ncbi:Leucine rich repeat containing protein BspA family protein [Entamoeba marina]
MIVSKYFLSSSDFIQLACINTKCSEILHMFHYNPISNCKLFPNIQTQYFYRPFDRKLQIPKVVNVYAYPVTYEEYIKRKCRRSKFQSVIITSRTLATSTELPIHCNQIPNNFSSKRGYQVSKIASNLQQFTNLTKIGSHAFYKNYNVRLVNLPTSLRIISNDVFRKCRIQTIFLPPSITHIGNYVFADCSQLQNISLPPNLSIIPKYAFFNCTSLTSVTLPKLLNTISLHSFDNCGIQNMYFPPFLTQFSTASFRIPSSLTTLPPLCFYNCKNLNRLTWPTRQRFIGESCFEGSPISIT